MLTNYPAHLSQALDVLGRELLHADVVDIGEWQSTKTTSPLQATRELVDVSIRYEVPNGQSELVADCQPSWPWAEDHFQERVGGEPLNPGEQFQNWPWYGGTKGQHQTQGEKFSHTYMERYWPKHAGHNWGLKPEYTQPVEEHPPVCHNEGVRFAYGDLGDVVGLLQRSPMTRQAYLPVWFPEDTGTVHGERVPCSIGYHFMQRQGLLSCRYMLRSCDYFRHLRDDIYMTSRLMQWVCKEVGLGWKPGPLSILIGSLHIFEGDVWRLEAQLKK